MARVTGTIKWFSSRKGFGFLAPTSDNSPTTEELFVHHSALKMQEGAYRTVAEGAEVEFEVETDSNGKLKAVNVTNVGGSPLAPPKREKRRRKPANRGGDENEAENKGGAKKGASEQQAPRKRDHPFHDVIEASIKTQITAKGLQLVRNTVDLALGGSRIKLGQGGYASLVDASGKVGEGSFTCDENAKVLFTWERCLECKDGKWQSADASQLIASLSLTDDGVGPVEPGETAEALWGADTPDPKDLFPEHGFKMKRVILTRPLKSNRGATAAAKSE